MSPRCCDSKLMWQMSRGSYGLYGGWGAKCVPSFIQGVGYLSAYPNWNSPSAMATFRQHPQSGDTIITGCAEAYQDQDPPFATSDNQTNSYAHLFAVWAAEGNAPVQLNIATDVASSQSSPFTVTCSNAGGYPTNPINVFLLEFSDLSGQNQSIVDALTWNAQLTGSSPFSCGSFSTTAINDLIISIYSNFDEPGNNPAGIAPTPGSIPACLGTPNNTCAAQDDSLYLINGISTYTAYATGQYTPIWTGPSPTVMSCASLALKVIGP